MGVDHVTAGNGQPDRPDVFVSYARRDGGFVQPLVAALVERGKDVWVDLEDVPKGADWRARIESGIESARAVVAVLSPSFAGSQVCGEEIHHAVRHNKRLIPILIEDVSPEQLVPELNVPNWILARENDDRTRTVDQLVDALEADFAWLDQHARLVVRSSEWLRHERDRSFLLRGSDLEAAERWLAESAQHRESPTGDQRSFVAASRKAARRRRGILIGTGAAATVAAIAGLVVLEDQRSEARRERERATSRSAAARADALRETQVDVSRLLSFEAYRLARTAEARNSLVAAVTHSPSTVGLIRAPSTIYALTVSPGGDRVATAHGDGSVRVWDLEGRRESGRALTGHGDNPEATSTAVYAVAWSPDGRLLASGGWDRTLRLWDVARRRGAGMVIAHGEAVYAVAFSPDGKLVVSGGADRRPGAESQSDLIGTARFWDVATRRPLGRLLGSAKGGVFAVAFSPDGRTLATGGDDGTLRFWDVATRRQIRSFAAHRGRIWSLAYSENGRLLASAGEDEIVRTWDARSLEPMVLALDGHRGAIRQIAFGDDGRMLASVGDDETVRMWDAPAVAALGDALTGHAGVVSAVAFARGSRLLVTAGQDRTMRLWDVGTALRSGPAARNLGRLRTIAFSPNGRVLAVAGDGETIHLLDVSGRGAGDRIIPGHTDGVTALAFRGGNRLLTSAGFDGTARLWNVSGTRAQRRPPPLEVNSRGSPVALSHNGRFLAASDSRLVLRVGDVVTRRLFVRPAPGPPVSVAALALRRDGKLLALAAADGTVRLWDVEARRQQGEPLSGHVGTVIAVAFSRDGRRLVSGGNDGTVRVWDVAGGALIGEALAHNAPVYAVSFSPDGTVAASGGADARVRIWDLESFRQLGPPLAGHTRPILAVAFGPTGDTAASAGDDGTVRIWRRLPLSRDLEMLRRRVCALVGRNLTRAEWAEGLPDVSYRATCVR